MVAGVIVVHVTDDDVGDLRRIDIHGRNPRRHRLHQLPAARRADGSIESGVEHKQDFGTADRPDIIIERHGTVVLVAADEIVAGGALQVGVADCADFIIRCHGGMLAVTAATINS